MGDMVIFLCESEELPVTCWEQITARFGGHIPSGQRGPSASSGADGLSFFMRHARAAEPRGHAGTTLHQTNIEPTRQTRYDIHTMPQFDEEKQEEKLALLRREEEEDLVRILSQKYRLPYLDLSQVSINTDALRLVPEERAKNAEAAAFQKIGKKLSLAIRTPNNPHLPELLSHLKERGYSAEQFMVSSQSLERAWAHYADLSFAIETRAGVLDISNEEIQSLIKKLKNLDSIRSELHTVVGQKKAYRISRLLETVLAGALSSDASDIHIEPEEEYTRLRYRLDGVLTEVMQFDTETYRLILSRIKLLSGLKINIKNEAQDGRFSVRIDEYDIEIRTSILPGAYGESIVLRLLDPHTIALAVEELGIEPKMFEILSREIEKPNGMILNTGPTGSGKTTTLYAFLRKIHTPDIKIVTIEDPVEYHLPGIVQTQVDPKSYTFAEGLRSALRQDPDVIMIGEIRDGEVAETAVNSALTGHLVFSTLHTNNAAGAFPRLIDLRVDPTIIGSSVNLVMAQRLVRKLKDDCRKEVPLSPERRAFVDRVLDSVEDKSLIPENTSVMWEPAENTPECETGYKGRVGVFEAIQVTEEIEDLVRQSAGEREINAAAQKQESLSLIQDGVIKALRGVTSFSELERVLDMT